MKQVCCSQIHFPIGDYRRRHCNRTSREAEERRGETNTARAVGITALQMKLPPFVPPHNIPSSPIRHGVSSRAACASKTVLLGAPGREKGAAATSARSSLRTETLQARNKIFAPCEGRGTWESGADKPFQRKKRTSFLQRPAAAS